MPDVAERTHLWQRAVKASGMDRFRFAIHCALMAEPLREVGAARAWDDAPRPTASRCASVVTMEAWASAHDWRQGTGMFGHETKRSHRPAHHFVLAQPTEGIAALGPAVSLDKGNASHCLE